MSGPGTAAAGPGRRVRVRTARDGAPAAVWSDGRWLAVAAVADHWVVETGWWRDPRVGPGGGAGPVSRALFRVALADGRCADLAADRLRGGWRCLRTWG